MSLSFLESLTEQCVLAIVVDLKKYMNEKPNLIIYRNLLLPFSEGFIPNQAESLTRFNPYYVGLRSSKGLQLLSSKVISASDAGWQGILTEASAKLGFFPPSFTRRIRSVNPILIHAHFGPDGLTALPLANLLNIPLVVTFHGHDATIKDQYAKRINYTFRKYVQNREKLQKSGKLFIAVSDFIRAKLIEQGFPESKLVTHYIGIDVDLFSPDGSDEREPIVLFVGRLVEKKGCQYLIQAMSRVQAVLPNAELVVIGDGVLKAELEKLADEQLKRYRFLGVQPPDQVRKWMGRAMVFSVPSITSSNGDSEGLGLVFLEAQAMGTPVVSSRHGGIPEAVEHNLTGFLAGERSSDELAEFILNLFQNKLLWKEFSKNGQVRVRKMFNLKEQTLKLEELYGQVLVSR